MKRFVGSLMALSLLTAGAAFAVPQQHDDHDHDHDRDRNAQRYDEHGPDRLMIIAMTGMTTGATIATTHIMTITAMARRMGAASVWHRTMVQPRCRLPQAPCQANAARARMASCG